jgi:N6-adenosine-specific RNA methylase IME4
VYRKGLYPRLQGGSKRKGEKDDAEADKAVSQTVQMEEGQNGAGFCVSGFNRRTELVLVEYKGILKNVLKQESEYIPTVFYEQWTTHSTKPVAMHEYIEKRTIGRRIELFARSTRRGWTSWGNEL